MADLSNIPTEQLEAFLKKGSGASSSPDLSNMSTADLETLLKNNAPAPQVAPAQGQAQPTFAQSLTSDWSKRADKVKNSGLRTSGAQSIYAAGQVAGGALDVAGETLSRITPAFIKGGVKNVTDFYGGLANQGINKLQETFPEATSAIKNFANSPIGKGMGQALETGINIGSIIPVGRGAQLAAPKVGEIAAKVIPQATQEVLEKGLKYTIRENYSKAFKPTVAGKKTFERTGKYFDNVQSAVEDITVNKEKLLLTTKEGESVAKLPGNPSEFAQSISQRKTDIYKEYHQMAVAAGDEGSKFNSAPILEKLDTLSKDLKQNPQTREYSKSLKAEIKELHGQSPEVIEARIKDLNNSLGGYYEGRIGKAKTQVDASVAELMRSELDNSIMKSQGEGYQNLKRRYGSLLAIEGDVNKRAIVYGRQNARGFFDLTDVFTGSAFTHGLLTMNPALMASAGAGIGIKNLTKWMNSPDRYIKNMFSKTENIIKRRGVQPNISPIMPGEKAVSEKIVQPRATSGGKGEKTYEPKDIVQPGAKDPEVKKVKSFTTDEGKFSVYDIGKDIRGRADMFTVKEDPSGWIVRNAFVPENMQKKGIATELYKKLNTESIKKTGNPLQSTRPRTLSTGEKVHEVSDQGVKLWDSLVKKGYAEKLGEKDYRFKGGTSKRK